MLTKPQRELLRKLEDGRLVDTSPALGMVIKVLRARDLVERHPNRFTSSTVRITAAGREALAADGGGR